MHNLLLSAFSDEYTDDFEQQLQMLKENNIQYIELRFSDKKNISLMEKDEILHLKALLSKYNITPSALGSPLFKEDIGLDFTAYQKTMEKVFQNANLLNVKNIRMFSFYMAEDKKAECLPLVLQYLSIALDMADAYGVTLCLENEKGLYGESPDECLTLLKHFKGRLKHVFDMGNYTLSQHDTLKAYPALRAYIEYFHIKDATTKGIITLPMHGEGNIKEILTDFSVYKKGAPFFASLEPHLFDFAGLSALASDSLKREKTYAQDEAFLLAIQEFRRHLQ